MPFILWSSQHGRDRRLLDVPCQGKPRVLRSAAKSSWEILLLKGTSGDGGVTMAMEGCGWNHLDQSCSCYLAIASAQEEGSERGLNSLQTEQAEFLSAFLTSCSSRCLRGSMLTVLRPSCTTLKVMPWPYLKKQTERHYGTPPLQPKESAIHSYLTSGLNYYWYRAPAPTAPSRTQKHTHSYWCQRFWLACIDQLGEIIAHSISFIKPKKRNKQTDATSSERIIRFYFFFLHV